MVTRSQATFAGVLGTVWGVCGVLYILGEAAWRLGHITLEGIAMMGSLQWVVCIAWVIFNAYAEGYKGFQRAFAPRVAVRAREVWMRPNALRVLLSPLFLMGLVDATRKRMTVSWILVVAIVGVVTVVRRLDQPWRGIIDAGVVVGLGWGIFAILVYLFRVAAGRARDVDPELAK